MIIQSDSLEFLKGIKDYDNDIIYCDPPYALGSEVIIRKDGKVDYKKANDFMSKWEMPTGDYWEKWFNEAYRTLKHGGWLIMFGMDRQLLLFKYYAHLAGFEEQQSLYWYFISNFPKATDLSKMIDKNLGEERSETYIREDYNKKSNKNNFDTNAVGIQGEKGVYSLPSSDLAKKYDGYKYSISPLKQTNETIMVFKKPTKTGSVLHDTLAYENGDKTITVGAIDIDGNRCGTSGGGWKGSGSEFWGTGSKQEVEEVNGRYPAQTFIDSQVAERLDLQSGVIKSSSSEYNFELANNDNPSHLATNIKSGVHFGDIGGCSKILHKCDFEQTDYDLYFYEPKVSSSERNAGCDSLEEKVGGSYEFRQDGSLDGKVPSNKNTHPTLKPIELNHRVLKLFKTPNDQKICYPFGGAGSEIIGGIKAWFNNWIACELNQEYVDIAKARIEYWENSMYTQTDIFDFI